MIDLLAVCGFCPWARATIGRSAVGQKILLDVVTIRLEQDVGAAELADLLVGPLDHAVSLAGLLIEHLPGAGDLEALLGARLGLDLGHLALLWRDETRGPVRRSFARCERAD